MNKLVGAKTLFFPTPFLLVGTFEEADKSSTLMNATWGGICCSEPPCGTVPRR